MDREAAATLGAPDHWFRLWMPHEFVPLSGNGSDLEGDAEEWGHVYLPLNRALRPLGVGCPGFVRFRDFAAQALVFRADPRGFEGVWYEPPGGGVGATPEGAGGLRRRRLLLYDDTPESRMDYFARFERLMARASRLHGGAPGLSSDAVA